MKTSISCTSDILLQIVAYHLKKGEGNKRHANLSALEEKSNKSGPTSFHQVHWFFQKVRLSVSNVLRNSWRQVSRTSSCADTLSLFVNQRAVIRYNGQHTSGFEIGKGASQVMYSDTKICSLLIQRKAWNWSASSFGNSVWGKGLA